MVEKNGSYSAPPRPYWEEDEIDLYELWLVIKKRKAIIFITTFVFIFLAGLYLLITPSVYQSSFILKKGLLSPFQIKKYIDNLQFLLKEGRYDDLEKLLEIHSSKIEKIKSIEASIPRNEKSMVQVNVEVLDPTLIKPLEKAIVAYISNQPLVQRTLSIKKKVLISMIENLKEGIKTLQELQKDSKMTDLEMDPLEIQVTIKNYQDQLAGIQSDLALLRPLFLATSAVVPTKPSKPKKKLVLAVAGVSGIFLGIFLAFFSEWLAQARKRYEG